MKCETCGAEMHWHGDPIGGFLCDYCDSDTISRWLRSDPYEDVEEDYDY
jgi:hypothetical protein